MGLTWTLLVLLLASSAHALSSVGQPLSPCVTPAGATALVDACGVCGGDGSSCLCGQGYLGLSQADTDAAVLCYVNQALAKQLDAGIAQMDAFLAALARQDCQASERLDFGAWLATVMAFCQGNACPTLASPNLYAFLQANVAFNGVAGMIAPMVGAD